MMKSEDIKLPWGQKKTFPKNARKVFEGVIFDVYQWQQEMFDGSLETFEKLKRADTVQVIAVTDSGKILILEETQPGTDKYLALPGGRIDPNEEPLTAAKRELLEETGAESSDWELFFYSAPFHKIDWIIYFFIARNTKKTSTPKLDPGEKIATREVSFEEFFELLTQEVIFSPELEIEVLKAKLDEYKMQNLKDKLGLL